MIEDKSCEFNEFAGTTKVESYVPAGCQTRTVVGVLKVEILNTTGTLFACPTVTHGAANQKTESICPKDLDDAINNSVTVSILRSNLIVQVIFVLHFEAQYFY